MNPQPIVYLIDDDEEVRLALCCVLMAASLEVETFSSADRFLANYEPGHPGCILLDIDLPGMTGDELLKMLRERDYAIPVVILSGCIDVFTIVRTMKLGVFDFATSRSCPPPWWTWCGVRWSRTKSKWRST